MASIFREYDIRGIVGQDLTEPIAEQIGLTFGTLLRRQGARAVSVARDGRASSPALFDRLTRGLTATGLTVLDIGLVPTPLLYFSLHHLPVQGGVMITGSHNPADYNGFKLCVGKESIHGEALQRLRAEMEAGKFDRAGGGRIEQRDVIAPYLDLIRQQFGALGASGLSIVADYGNGTAGVVGPQALRIPGCRVTDLYAEVDARFPNHHPDPTVAENLNDLIREVKRLRADAGIAFDGDADRIGVVDEKGGILWGDQIMILFAREILHRRPGAQFISEVKARQALYDDIRARGGKALMWRTGHSLLKAKMKEVDAALAGEMSGHIFFADRYLGYDDAIYAGCRLIEILTRQGKALSSLLADLPPTATTPEIRVDRPDDKKFAVVERLRARLEAQQRRGGGTPPIRELITVDGVRVVLEDGWGLVRASNTQPVLVLRFEAGSTQRLQQIREWLETELRAAEAQV
jgi:phosphomannomutase/phosphoglucomutase